MPQTKQQVDVKKKKRRVVEIQAPVEVKRGRGRPRKAVTIVAPAPTNKSAKVTKKLKTVKEVPVTDHRRKSRVHNTHLLLTDGESNRVQLPATRVIEQLTSLLERAEVQQFRGRRERPQLILSMLESQALQEAKVLFELKLSMQRDGQLRRKRVG